MFYCDFKCMLNRSSKCVCSAVTMSKQMHRLGNTHQPAWHELVQAGVTCPSVGWIPSRGLAGSSHPHFSLSLKSIKTLSCINSCDNGTSYLMMHYDYMLIIP